MVVTLMKKNVECLVDIKVDTYLPFGSEVFQNLFKSEWLEFPYKLSNLKLHKKCRCLDHSTKI